ncbi:MAG: ATP-binding protein [Oscillospiraceae bacterium]|nr:ATP-binding protein [Oscillospiraceae bacterium]
MKELTIDATVENITSVTDFVDEQLEEFGCPLKAKMQIDIAIDELFGNIAHYAYKPDVGPATVRVEVNENPLAVIITFIDHGVQYDPLSAREPDTTLSAEERSIGGLGIYIVKKSMDEITYEYKDGQNILKIKKNIYGNTD